MKKIINQNSEQDYKNGEFEFLIRGEIEFPDNWKEILTPNSLKVEEIIEDEWFDFKVGDDMFSYSFEEPGIQMTFNKEMEFNKAKKIADEVIENIKQTGQNAELLILDNSKTYSFD